MYMQPTFCCCEDTTQLARYAHFPLPIKIGAQICCHSESKHHLRQIFSASAWTSKDKGRFDVPEIKTNQSECPERAGFLKQIHLQTHQDPTILEKNYKIIVLNL